MEKLKLIKCWRTSVILLSMVLFSGSLFAQNSTIRGKIVDEAGQPLVGATIRLTGTTNGVVADVDGNFALVTTASTKSITISFVGYLDFVKAITPGTTNVGTIPLAKDPRNLNEVVVVGYGTIKRADVTGTVATVDSKTLQEIPASNVFEELKGRVAGLDVNESPNGPIITIRGNRTITQNATTLDQPLIVLDGQPYYNSIENISPNDIKSVDVLKGASATAIYGSRASSGVILITTNRGRVGQTVTSYDSYYGYSRLLGNIATLNGQQFNQLHIDALQGAILQGSGSTDPYALTTQEQAALAAGVNTDWTQLLIKPSMVWDQSLRVSGGTDKTQFTVGTGYRVSTGLEPNNDTKRISLNIALDHKLNKYIKFGLTTATDVRLINSGGGNQFQNAKYITPLASAYNADGSLNLQPQIGQIDATMLNPLWQGLNPDQNYNYTRGFVNNDILYTEITPINHLKYRYTVNYNFSQSLQGTYNGEDGVNVTTIAKTSAGTNNNYQYRLAQEHLLTYDNTFGKHSINFVAVFTNELQHNENSNINATGIPEDANLNKNLGLAAVITNVGGAYSEQGIVSYVGRLNYAYDSRYDLTATIRSDANSALAAGHQTTYYPSLGLGWVISNEKFMKPYSFIDNLKLRGGYGVTSTIASAGPYNTLGALSSSKYQYGGLSAGDAQGVRVTNLVNTDLTWQRTAEYNLALDFSVLKGRLNGTIEAYAQNTTGIILLNQLPITNGAPNQFVNSGSSANRGLELSLNSINIQNKGGFSWTSSFNIAFSRENIVALPNDAPSNIGAGQFVGSPLSVIYDVQKLGIWQQSEATQAAVFGQKPGQIKIQDVNGDGKITFADDQIIGHFQPQYEFGLGNRFSYKNLDLSIVIQGKMGFTTIVPYVSSSNSSTNGWQFLNLGRHNQPVLDYWTPNNPTNAFPEPNAQNQGSYFSTLQYYDGSWIRAKSINLGYTFSNNITKKIGMSSLRLYANVTNPFIIYAPIRRHGFSVPDPESQYGVAPADVSASGNIGGAAAGNSGAYRGVGINSGEQTRDFIIGINARF